MRRPDSPQAFTVSVPFSNYELQGSLRLLAKPNATLDCRIFQPSIYNDVKPKKLEDAFLKMGVKRRGESLRHTASPPASNRHLKFRTDSIIAIPFAS